jgi:hypothetical protein
MTSHISKRVSDSQPAIILATILAAVSLSPRWPVAAVVFIGLQLATLMAAMATRFPRAHQAGFRFLARASAIAQPATVPASNSRRAHLHLVP